MCRPISSLHQPLSPRTYSHAPQAHAVWSAMAKKHALETLPPEPSAEEGALCLVVCMAGSGRRLKRRWRLEDTVQHLFQFVFGHTTDGEDVGQVGEFALFTNFPTRRFDDASATLRSTALRNNTVLRVVRTEGDASSD